MASLVKIQVLLPRNTREMIDLLGSQEWDHGKEPVGTSTELVQLLALDNVVHDTLLSALLTSRIAREAHPGPKFLDDDRRSSFLVLATLIEVDGPRELGLG